MKKNEAGFFERLWNMFASVKMSVIVLVLIAVTSIAGTLIPQNQSMALYKKHYGESVFFILKRLGVFDMYHAVWFQFLLLLLAINLIICSLERFPSAWKISRKKMSRNPVRYNKKGAFSFNLRVLPVNAVTTIKHQLGKVSGNPIVEKKGENFCIFAEKGRWTKLGVYIVHISVLLLLVGGLAGSMAGFEGSVNIMEGEQTDRVYLKNSDKAVPLGFNIRCDDFHVSYYDTGAPEEYKSHLSIVENESVVLSKAIIVNDPLRYKGINIFQSSFGSIPSNSVTINFQSKKSGMIYPKKMLFNTEVVIPETKDTFLLSDYMESFNMKGRVLKNVFIGVCTKESGEKEMIVMPQALEWFDGMRRKDAPIHLSVADVEKKFYTGLQVTKDPGVWFVYAGFIIMIIGCYITFFMSHRMYCIEVTGQESGYTITLSGQASKNKYGMAVTVDRLGNKLKTLLEG